MVIEVSFISILFTNYFNLLFFYFKCELDVRGSVFLINQILSKNKKPSRLSCSLNYLGFINNPI